MTAPAGERQLDFLLADFNALKAEIARRSELQRIAVALYLALVAAVVASLSGNEDPALPIASLWGGGFAALLFWYREGLEIGRLGRLISDRIGEEASRILGVPARQIIPSEPATSIDAKADLAAGRLHLVFMWLIFVVVPVLLTSFALALGPCDASKLIAWKTPTPYVAAATLAAAVGTVGLLVKRR